MMEIEKYLTNINSAHNSGYTDTMTLDILDKLNRMMNLDGSTVDLLETVFDEIFNLYGDMGCSFVPIYHENVVDRLHAIGGYILMKMLKHASLITNITTVDGKLKLLNLNSGTVDKMTYNSTDTDTSVKNIFYGKSVLKGGNSNGYDMSENSPINAEINTINTPDNKRITSAGFSNSENNSGTDKHEDNKTVTKTGNDTRDITSPNDYKIYMELAYEYNIYHILLDIVKYTVWEYNRVR